MKRVLLTGISGVGKSSVTAELAARGYHSVDLDSDEYSHWVETSGDDEYGSTVEPGRDWMWREDRVREVLAHPHDDLLFASGTAANMGQFVPQFDHVILLSAPADLLAERLATRTTNAYGKHPAEAARVLGQIDTIQPLLRRVASHEIDTFAPLDEVVAMVLAIAEQS